MVLITVSLGVFSPKTLFGQQPNTVAKPLPCARLRRRTAIRGAPSRGALSPQHVPWGRKSQDRLFPAHLRFCWSCFLHSGVGLWARGLVCFSPQLDRKGSQRKMLCFLQPSATRQMAGCCVSPMSVFARAT
jgi:hypothetical protein